MDFLWNYDHWLLRPYVGSVNVSGGHTVMVLGKKRVLGATVNVHATLRDDPKLASAARHICQVAETGVQTLHLRAMISKVEVWSLEGHLLSRC